MTEQESKEFWANISKMLEKYEPDLTPYITQNDIHKIQHYIYVEKNLDKWFQWEHRKEIIKKFYPEFIEKIDTIKQLERDIKRLAEKIYVENIEGGKDIDWW